MLTSCSEPGCETVVMDGGLCLAHESRVVRVFPRGRPFVPAPQRRITVMQREAVLYAGHSSRSLVETPRP
jgi:hypothetical protein